MIDLHNHILPTLDDGARGLDEALAMAKMAVGIGTTIMAATPHRFMKGREIVSDVIHARVDALQRELDSREIPLRLLPGSEIPFGPDVVDGLREGRLVRIGGATGTHALIETPFEAIPGTAISVLDQLADAGIGVVLAHPERNEEVQQNLAFVESAAALGAILQITSGSVLGAFGPLAQATAKAIVERSEWQVIIASDAHWAHDRTTDQLRAASTRVAEWIGDAARAEWMVSDGPSSCISPLI